MSGPDPATVDARLRSLDGAALRALVADLWAARGFETIREGELVEAVGARGRVLIWVPAAGESARPPEPDLDIVVSIGDAGPPMEGPREVGVAGLREMLLYALERPVADRLATRHLGATLSGLRPPPSVRLRTWIRAAAAPRSVAVLGMALTLAVLAGAGTGAGPLADLATGGDPDGATDAGPATVEALDPAALTPEPSTGRAGSERLAPGVSREGIVDVQALAGAHERAVTNRPHAVGIDYTRPRDFDPDGTVVRREVRVRTDGERYRAVADELVVSTGARRRLGEIYDDGAGTYAVSYNGSAGEYGPVSVLDPNGTVRYAPSRVARTAVLRYLSVPETTVTARLREDGNTLYRVVGRGQPASPRLGAVANYTVAALVSPSGLVREIDVTYEEGVRELYPVSRTVTYDRIGTATVEVPEWFERRNGSDAGDG